MPAKNVELIERNPKLTAIIAALILGLVGLTLAGCWLQSYKSEKGIEETHQVIECLGNFESSAQRLGSSVRRYVNSKGDLELLAEYYGNEEKAENLIHSLKATFAERILQRARLIGLQQLLNERIEWERQVISTYQTDGQVKAAALLASSYGGSIMDKIRAQLNEIRDAENVLLADQLYAYHVYKAFCLLSAAILAMFGGLSLWQAIRNSLVSRKLEAQQVLAYERMEQLNKVLNKQVAELLQAQEETNKAIKIRAEFLAKVSHNLRTPLTGILGATELILETPLPESQRNLIDIVKQSSNQLLGLVNDILDFQHLQLQEFKLEQVAFDLRIAIQSALQPLEAKAVKKGITLNWQIYPAVPFLVYGDRSRVQQVLVNLVDSAIDTQDNGHVSVEIMAKNIGDRSIVSFFICDNGTGTITDRLQKLFEPAADLSSFGTDETSHTGMGVSVGKKLIELLAGRMEFVTEPGGTTKFGFSIPLNLSADSSSEPKRLVAVSPTRASGSKILVVDDNPIVRSVTEAQLKRLGWDVALAASGDEAIELTKKQRYILIFMDIQMPGLDGLAATKIIRTSNNFCREIPIVAYTAQALPGDEDMFLDAGMDDFVSKPITLASLESIINKWAAPSIYDHFQEKRRDPTEHRLKT